MSGFASWLRQLDLTSLLDMALVVAASLFSITVHETCHGYVAYLLGDPTAKRLGRLTLNPLKHVDLVGLVMMAIVHFGWAKPVPIDMRYFKKPKAGMALTALAGPVSNVLLAFLSLLLLLTVSVLAPQTAVIGYLCDFLQYVAIISTGLAVFNFIPISPLDGSKVLFSFLPEQLYLKLMRVERYGMILLVVLLTTGVIDRPLNLLRNGLMNALFAAAYWIVSAVASLF